jgi:RimJ/RimL family protein N-acetyltransferase
VNGDSLELTDGVATLRPFRSEDAPAVFEACQDPEIARWVPIPQPYTMEIAESFVDGSLGSRPVGGSGSLAITDAQSRRVRGSIGRHGPNGHRVAFGYWLAPWSRG